MESYKSFSPGESIAFQRMVDSLRAAFESFGFIPFSTSAFVDMTTMQDKTGINEFYEIIDPTGKLVNMGLCVDHTVPLSIFVSQNIKKLTFPFKCYTTRPVYRPTGEDGYNEFHSCDIDVIGSRELSIIYDAEILALIKKTLVSIGLYDENSKPAFCIHINSRKIINAIFDKIGIDEEKRKFVRKAMGKNNQKDLSELLDDRKLSIVRDFASINGSNEDVLSALYGILGKEYESVVKELEITYRNALKLGLDDACLRIDPVLTRNMSYYSGLTCCTYLRDYPEIGSICHGGRYNIRLGDDKDDLTGVGVTIHMTQLFDCLVEHGIIKKDKSTVSQIMVSGIGSIEDAMYISNRLREDCIKVEMFLDQEMSLDEQIEYAKRRGFRLFVWTDRIKDVASKITADDLVYVWDFKPPSLKQTVVCWQFFNVAKTLLGISVY